ncbi:hypothetical protein IFR04_012292 [Cadophora malorum]|uniref:Clr5 domain-containing protein n=1 Tax=Cadophora malorum TaxID=108018 RepID=A0A8H7T3I5_9HELO|nr:hypothetical protein IFR04_012292 [Cadophora malorum]
MDRPFSIGTQDMKSSALGVTSRSGPTKTEWDSRRPQITRLYCDEKLKLKDVMSIMEQAGFVANERMYKDRITRWGLCKNIKKHEAVALIQRKAERDLMRKRTTIELHGQLVGMGRLLRHTKGPGSGKPGSRASIPSYVQCKTPPPGAGAFIGPFAPVDGDMLPAWEACLSTDMISTSSGSLYSATQLLPGMMMWSENFNEDTGSNSNDYTVEENSQMKLLRNYSRSSIHGSNISRPMSPLTSLKIPEELFHTIKEHLVYTFQSGVRTFDRHGLPAENNADMLLPNCIANFSDHCYNAWELNRKGSFDDFRRLLSKAFGLVPDILRAPHPQALGCFLDVFFLFGRRDMIEITHSLRRYITQMGDKVIGDHVPLRRICRLLGTVEPELLQETAIRAWRCNNDAFQNEFGRFTKTSLMAELSYTKSVYGLYNLVERERLLRKLLLEFEEKLGPSNSLVMVITLHLGNNIFNQGKYMEAEILGEEIMVASQAENSELPLEIQPGSATLVAKFPEVLGLTGIIEVQPGIFYVTGGQPRDFADEAGSYKIWEVDIRSCNTDATTKTENVADLSTIAFVNRRGGKTTFRRVKIDESVQAVGDVEVLEKNILVDDIVFDDKGNAGWRRMC